MSTSLTTGTGRLDVEPRLSGRPTIVAPQPMGTPLSFTLQCEGIPGAVEYEIQEARGVGFLNPDRLWQTSETSLQIDAPRPNDCYYRVRGVNAGDPATRRKREPAEVR